MKRIILMIFILAILAGVTDVSSANVVNMSYRLSVFDPNYIYESTPTIIYYNGTLQQLSPLATATVSPDSSWYRPNPNTYQNTTVIRINRSRTKITLKFPNGTMTVTDATRTGFEASSDSSQSYVTINNTLPEYAYQNLSFTVDGVNYANGTADSTGFISINYTGTWSASTGSEALDSPNTDTSSKHTFKWISETDLSKFDVNKDGEINILDLNMIAQNLGQTSTSCPACDVDGDGVITEFDLNIVAWSFGEKTN